MIIKSLLDTDLYKLTMCQIVYHQFPDTVCTYGFKLRTKGVDLTPYREEIERQINSLGELKFYLHELNFLKTLSFLKEDFINHLSTLQLQPRKQVRVFNEEGELRIEIEGRWLDTIWYEIPVLSIVNEVYFRNIADPDYAQVIGLKRLEEKIQIAKEIPSGNEMPFAWACFGSRRRFSSEWQRKILKIISRQKGLNFIGTSNVAAAYELGLKPIGTMAHEFFQAAQVLAPSLEESQSFALKAWTKEYGTQLGVALTDIFGVDVFLKDFDRDLAQTYAAVRHDSGDWWEFTQKVRDHYLSLDIDPATKTLVFSDGLSFPQMKEISEVVSGPNMPKVSFGIGTNFTNDCGYEPLSIVMKMITCNGSPTAKVSDSPGKGMCRDELYIERINKMIKEKLK